MGAFVLPFEKATHTLTFKFQSFAVKHAVSFQRAVALLLQGLPK